MYSRTKTTILSTEIVFRTEVARDGISVGGCGRSKQLDTVTTVFEHEQVKPLRVTWNDRVYYVTNVNCVWREGVGATRHTHLTVETREGISMELLIDPKICRGG